MAVSARSVIVSRSSVPRRVGLGDRFVAELVAGVRCVGDQFAEEDLFVGIDRVHHQVQQTTNLCLERLFGID